MEAVPRLPMLSFEPISYYTKNVQFATDLMGLIRQHYQEEPSNYIEEVQQLEKLRQQATKLTKDIDGVNTLKRYFCQLYFLQKRFPSLKDTTVSPESFWKDILGSSGPRKIDYRSEFTTTLFNIGALHSQLGAADDRTTSEGLKLACTHFQCAAWAFKHLREVTSATSRPEYDHGYLQFLISTCLAQAQECIAEKSISDNRKPSISAKVVTQIGEYYESAKHALSRLIPGENGLLDYGIPNPPAYMNYLQFKQTYYKCIADLFLGMQAEEEEKMGKRVAYFELASDELKEAFRYAKKIIDCQSLTKGVDEALNFTHDVVEGKRKNAVSENEFIYHEDVPPKDNLEKVKGASLVKCIGFDINDPEISGPDIFSKLISMKVHKLSSVYSEEKAKLLRSVSSSVEEKESELNTFMQSLKLDYLNPAENPNILPEELIERCAACEAKPTLIQELIDSMNKVNDAHHEMETMMKEVVEFIKKEEKAEEEYQMIMNSAQPLSTITAELKCEMTHYQEKLEKVTKSNEALRNAISAHVNNLRILSLPLDELEKQLPRVYLEYSPEEQSVVQELQRLVNKVEEMKNQRASLMSQLRESLRNDDITDQIALSDEDKGVFSVMVVKEIAKHQNGVNLIEQNLKAQSNILKAITNTYATYAPIRKIISETAQKRSSQINALIESFDISDNILEKTAKALDFYRSHEVNVRKLLSRVKGTCKVCEEERLQVYAKTGKKIPKSMLNETIPPAPVSSSSIPAAPKLKDYLAQKTLVKNINEPPSLPGSPYYPAASYVPTTTITPSGNVDRNQYYSTVARPPPVGSETTVIPSGLVEPTNIKEAKPFVLASNKMGYPYNYSYAYQIQPTNVTQISGYQDSHPRVGVPTTNYQAYNYPQNVHNTALHPSPATAGPYPQYSNTQAGKKPGVADISYNYTSAPQYTYPNQQTDVSNMNQNSVATITPVVTVATPGNLSTTYKTYGTNAVYHNMYASNQNPTSYASTSSSTYSNYNQSGMQPQNIPYTNTQTTMYNVDARNVTGATNYHQYSVTPGQTVYIQDNTPMAGVPTTISNTYDRYSMANQPVNYQSSKHAYNHGVTAVYQSQNYARLNCPMTESPHPEVISSTPQFTGVDALTYNISHYTNAGHYFTQNIESSSKSLDGRSYATQYANENQSIIAPPITSNADQRYYTSQYGQQHESNEEHKTNVETSTKGQERHSMTYMQADSNGRTNSTYSVNSSNTTREEKKNESNIDLLADLDFDVTDTPLLPISEAAAANKILEKLTNLNVSGSLENKKEPSTTEEIAKTIPTSDPFSNQDYLSKFVLEAEKFEKFVDKLTLKTLNGSMPIDTLWNEYVVEQEKISKNQTMEMAKKHITKNRFSGSVPYDNSRVYLPLSESNYINASLIKNSNPAIPNLILTQNPLSCTIPDFWHMIWDQNTELIICLINENEIEDDIYWPKEKNEKLEIDDMVITLHSCNTHPNRIERIFSVLKDNTCRILTHMQVISWQDVSSTKISNPIIELLNECVSFYYAQRDLGHCIVLHCDTGAGRSGLFALLCTFVCEIKSGRGVPDLMALLKLMSESKKYLINDKQNLLFAFQLSWFYIHSILIKYEKRSLSDVSKFDLKRAENVGDSETMLFSGTRMMPQSEVKLSDRSLSKEENKRRNIERFNASGSGNWESLTQSAQQDNDPFSSLDPLWSIKKEQS